VQRYPNQAAHDKERSAALAQVDQVTATAQTRVDELAAERKALNQELEFFKKDLSKAPPKLRRQFDENDKNTESQKRFMNEQQSEKARLNARFDAELARLKQLWAANNAAAAPAPEPTVNKAAVEAAKPKR
jgi:chromosome segregation ATPase